MSLSLHNLFLASTDQGFLQYLVLPTLLLHIAKALIKPEQNWCTPPI